MDKRDRKNRKQKQTSWAKVDMKCRSRDGRPEIKEVKCSQGNEVDEKKEYCSERPASGLVVKGGRLTKPAHGHTKSDDRRQCHHAEYLNGKLNDWGPGKDEVGANRIQKGKNRHDL